MRLEDFGIDELDVRYRDRAVAYINGGLIYNESHRACFLDYTEEYNENLSSEFEVSHNSRPEPSELRDYTFRVLFGHVVGERVFLEVYTEYQEFYTEKDLVECVALLKANHKKIYLVYSSWGAYDPRIEEVG